MAENTTIVVNRELALDYIEKRKALFTRALEFLPEEREREVTDVEFYHEERFVYIHWRYLNGGLLLNGTTIALTFHDFFRE